MKSVQDIWKNRLSEYLKELRTYLRYMFNDHLLFVMIFVVGGGAYWYQGWLRNIPETFPAPFIIPLLFTFVVTFAHVRTLLKEPDIVFLLPLEKEFSTYFKRAFTYSYISQLYPLIIVTVIIVPLYVRVFSTSSSGLFILFGTLLLVKLWNQAVHWHLTHFPDRASQMSDVIVRFVINFLFIYFFIVKAHMFTLLMIIIMVLYWLYFKQMAKKKSVKWEFLIDEENRRQHTFYRIANLFTDVPKLKNKVKRRSWLDWTLAAFSYKQENTFFYLYARSFLRTGDYFGIFIRLLGIAVVIAFFIPLSFIGSVLLSATMLFLTSIQLVSLFKQHDILTVPRLYPVKHSLKQKSFLRLLFIILVIQEGLLTIAVMIQTTIGIGFIQLGINIAFAYILVYTYLSKRFVK
ncbi:ABC transporter permease [Bacillus sp. FJAT-47783]|uniref:ABC transporter permease n=1 Tax=Bacillus sp. FJAT-47783 TaxID=2922712 RepID=UPI001FAC0F94|nr:ABC transporter permease [Bacillus sp. FJAT-47783]